MSDGTGRPKGGGFMVEKACQRKIFLPEDLPEDVIAMGQAAYEFIESAIIPRIDEFEASVKIFLDFIPFVGDPNLGLDCASRIDIICHGLILLFMIGQVSSPPAERMIPGCPTP